MQGGGLGFDSKPAELPLAHSQAYVPVPRLKSSSYCRTLHLPHPAGSCVELWGLSLQAATVPVSQLGCVGFIKQQEVI